VSRSANQRWDVFETSVLECIGTVGLYAAFSLNNSVTSEPILIHTMEIPTRNRKHRRAAAKPTACAKPLMLSTPGSKGKRRGKGGEVGKEVGRNGGRRDWKEGTERKGERKGGR